MAVANCPQPIFFLHICVSRSQHSSNIPPASAQMACDFNHAQPPGGKGPKKLQVNLYLNLRAIIQPRVLRTLRTRLTTRMWTNRTNHPGRTLALALTLSLLMDLIHLMLMRKMLATQGMTKLDQRKKTASSNQETNDEEWPIFDLNFETAMWSEGILSFDDLELTEEQNVKSSNFKAQLFTLNCFSG